MSDSSPALSRRRFFTLASAVGAVPSAASSASHPDRFKEPEHDLPLVNDVDVIVCGGGPAGVSAALTAARAGARTRLIEVHGCLGGVWTAGLLTYIFDFDKPGLTQELARRLDERNARRSKHKSRFVYEPEAMKRLLEEMCVEAGIQIHLHTRVAAAYRDGRRLTTIVTESKSGREAWRAPVFIDATGDGDLGAQAGCQWEFGQGKDCPCQPMTLNALAVVKDAKALGGYMSFYDNDERHLPAVEAFAAELKRAGIETSYGHPTLFHIRDNLVLVMINHEYGIQAFNERQISEATIRARAEVHRVVDALRKLGGVWENMQVAASAEQIGVRDGRRIKGRYTVGWEDLAKGARHDDGVARVTFPVDIHAADKETNKSTPVAHSDFKFHPYDIPLRALIAADVDGLMLAGRCISGDFIAHASYRVTGNAVAMGEAAGVVAALAAKTKRLPHEVPWGEGAELLAKIRTKA